MTLRTESYLAQLDRWPQRGRHILAQFDEQTVVVYQAFCAPIARFATEHQHFGGEFSFNRMSWIKPNFLWMMYRCGWATKKDQESVMAIHLRRDAFDQILSLAVHSTFTPDVYASPEQWEQAVAHSNVRLQWDPDHDPSGRALERRAIQLGMRGEVLCHYARDWIVKIQDITDFVKAQHQVLLSAGEGSLQTPSEAVYTVRDQKISANLRVETIP